MTLTTYIIICTIGAGIFALTTAVLQIIKSIDDAKSSAITAQRNEKNAQDLNKQQQKLNDLQQKLLKKTNDLVETQQLTINDGKRIIELQNKLNEKNEKIEEIQNATLNNLTGGKNMPILEIIAAGGSALFIRISNPSKSPIRNVTIKLLMLVRDFEVPVNATFSTLSGPSFNKEWDTDIGNLPINFPMGKEALNIKNEQQYDSITYIYYVRWLTGDYTGNFTVENGKTDNFKIVRNQIEGAEGLDFSKAVIVNQEWAKVIDRDPK